MIVNFSLSARWYKIFELDLILFLQLFIKVETLYVEISNVLDQLETKIVSPGIGNESSDICDIQNHILDLKDMLQRERTDYQVSKLIYICCLCNVTLLSYGTWFLLNLVGCKCLYVCAHSEILLLNMYGSYVSNSLFLFSFSHSCLCSVCYSQAQ